MTAVEARLFGRAKRCRRRTYLSRQENSSGRDLSDKNSGLSTTFDHSNFGWATARSRRWDSHLSETGSHLDSILKHPGFGATSFLVKTQDSGRESARSRFRLRAADRVEKWSPAGCSDSGKSSPLIVPPTGFNGPIPLTLDRARDVALAGG